MKRYSTLLAMLLLAVCCAGAAHAIFPGPIYGTVPSTTLGDGYLTFTMQQGWYNGYPAWYICTDTNDIRWAQWYNLTLAPKLSSAFFGAGASAMFVVLNPAASQGPIFETMPGQALYTPIWRVRYVTWNPGATKVPLTSIGQILALQGAGQLTWLDTDIRVNCSILAVGQLGGPWQGIPPLRYRIPQGRIIPCTPPNLQIQLPFWYVYCQDPITRAISVRRVIIPDAYPPDLAALIGANIAPRLVGLDKANRSDFWVINWAQDWNANLPGIQPLKVLANQYPVLCDCPNNCSWRNTNFNYSPVTTFRLLNRTNLPAAEILVKTCEFVQIQLNNGNLVKVVYPTPPLPQPPGVLPVTAAAQAGYVLNSPVLCDNGTIGRICP